MFKCSLIRLHAFDNTCRKKKKKKVEYFRFVVLKIHLFDITFLSWSAVCMCEEKKNCHSVKLRSYSTLSLISWYCINLTVKSGLFQIWVGSLQMLAMPKMTATSFGTFDTGKGKELIEFSTESVTVNWQNLSVVVSSSCYVLMQNWSLCMKWNWGEH